MARDYETLFGNKNAQLYKPEEEPLVRELIIKYFKECDKDKRKYTMSGLAQALGMSRNTLVNYSSKEPFCDLIKNAKQIVETQLEEMVVDKKEFCPGQIFNLKNNYGWKDQQEIKTTSEVNISPLESAMEKLVESSND